MAYGRTKIERSTAIVESGWDFAADARFELVYARSDAGDEHRDFGATELCAGCGYDGGDGW